MHGELSFEPGVRYGLAFSGGADSAYLLTEMVRRGVDVKAYMVKTAFQSSDDVDDAREVVAQTGAPFERIHVDILSHDEICSNPPDRCYHCKKLIFGTILEHMAIDGRTVLVDGTNATDDPARRPGFMALSEFGVISPLREAGYTKDDVRAESRRLGIFTADKPSFACYAVRVPEGERLTASALGRVMLAGKPDFECLDGGRRVFFSAPHSVVHVRNGKLKPAELDTDFIARELNRRWGFPVQIKTGNADDDPNRSEKSPYRDKLASRVAAGKSVALVDLHQMVNCHGQLMEIGTGKGLNILGRWDLAQEVVDCFVNRGIVPVATDSVFAALGDHTVSADISQRCGIPCFQIEMNSRLFLPRCEEYATDEVIDTLAAVGELLERET